jgi:protein-L-isoaspartate(D-aspartate) O-methyltransferase
MATDPSHHYPLLEMLSDIREDARATAHLTGRAMIGAPVLRAIQKVPRNLFVPAGFRPLAWRNRPLSIGHGQTISQPFIVALMTDLLDLEPESRVLEIGTGSGYQAAVLAEMGMRVNSVEILEPLARKAAAALAQAGYCEVALRVGDGCSGWPERAPFDGIVVTAAPLRVPRELARQLAPGGRLVIPVGRSGGYQELMRGEMGRDGKLHWARVLPVAFVPCTGDAGCGAVSG